MPRQEILKDIGGTITYKKYFDNVQAIPSSATVSIVTKLGSAMPAEITNAVCSIDSYGTISYTVSATNAVDLGESFKATFEYLIDSTTYYDIILFDIVRKKLEPMITDIDLINEYAGLDKIQYRVFGSVTALSTIDTTINDDNLNADYNSYKGGEVEILSGSNIGFMSTVTMYDDVTRTIHIENSLPYVLAIGDKFLICRSFKTEIARAFDEIKEYIRTQGYRPALVIDDTQLVEAHIALSIKKILLPLGEEYRYSYEEYSKIYEKKLLELKLVYDADESGTVDDDEEDLNTSQIRLKR
jgi:hypothetical protein